MNLPTLTQIAKGEATFEYFKNGVLYYRLLWYRDGEVPGSVLYKPQILDIPIPVDDTGDGSFLPKMRGIELVRWARKHVDFLRESAKEQRIGEDHATYLEGLEEDP